MSDYRRVTESEHENIIFLRDHLRLLTDEETRALLDDSKT